MGLFSKAIEQAQTADDPYLDGLVVQGETLDASQSLQFYEIHNGEFDHCVLSGVDFRKASFYDCTFVGCDLSNARLDEAFCARSRFVGCKLEGVQLTHAILRSVRMRECVCRYANMGEATFENVTLQGCDMREAFLSEVKFRRGTRLDGCDLTRADLFRTSLKGLDLSTCHIAGISVSDTRAELNGAIISADQAVDMVGLLGLRVKEYE